MDESPTDEGPVRIGTPAPRRVVVLRALKLGDMLCAVPALRSLREALPQAHISLLGMPWADCLVRRFPKYLDSFQAISRLSRPAGTSARYKRLAPFPRAHASGAL